MGARASDVLREALGLLPEERAELAAELLASLDGPVDVDAEAAWREEIERRARRVLSGESAGIASTSLGQARSARAVVKP